MLSESGELGSFVSRLPFLSVTFATNKRYAQFQIRNHKELNMYINEIEMMTIKRFQNSQINDLILFL